MALESYSHEAREPHTPIGRNIGRVRRVSVSPVSLSVFSLVPDLLFDGSRVLEYAKMRTVLQSKPNGKKLGKYSPTDAVAQPLGLKVKKSIDR